MKVILDSTPLGMLAHPNPRLEIVDWRRSIYLAGWTLIVPEIADYKVSRLSLLAHQEREGILLPGEMKQTLVYQPITTMLKAAELWADARRRGRPTADPKELHGDVILAEQAIEAGAIVATENVGHLSRYVTAKHWSLSFAA